MIHIKKKNMATQKSIKESSDRGQLILMRGQKSSVKVITLKHDIINDDQHPKSFKNVATSQ